MREIDCSATGSLWAEYQLEWNEFADTFTLSRLKEDIINRYLKDADPKDYTWFLYPTGKTTFKLVVEQNTQAGRHPYEPEYRHVKEVRHGLGT